MFYSTFVMRDNQRLYFFLGHTGGHKRGAQAQVSKVLPPNGPWVTEAILGWMDRGHSLRRNAPMGLLYKSIF